MFSGLLIHVHTSDYLSCLIVLTVLLLQFASSPKDVRLRKKLYLILIGVWLTITTLFVADYFQKSPFFDAVKSGDLDRVRELLVDNSSLIASENFFGDTALHIAVTSGNNDMIKVLLEAGADVNTKGASGVTPLHLASFYGNEKIAETLLSAGADVNAAGYRHNDTPLHVAALHGHVKVIYLLLIHGADRALENSLHQTPLQVAEENKQNDVINLLKAENGSSKK